MVDKSRSDSEARERMRRLRSYLLEIEAAGSYVEGKEVAVYDSVGSPLGILLRPLLHLGFHCLRLNRG